MSKDRTERFQIRLSPAEKAKLLKNAEQVKMSVSDYIVFLTEHRRAVDTSNIPKLILEIRRVGVNINQIALVANSQKSISYKSLSELKTREREIIHILEQILDEVYNPEDHTIKRLEAKIDKMTKSLERMNSNGSC